MHSKMHSDMKHLFHMVVPPNGHRSAPAQPPGAPNTDSFASPYVHLSSDGSLQRPSGPPVHVAWTTGQQNTETKDTKEVEQETSSLASFNSSNSSEVLPRKVPAAQFGTKVSHVFIFLTHKDYFVTFKPL